MNRDFYREITGIFIHARFSFRIKRNAEEAKENLIYFKSALHPYYEELKTHINENNNAILIYCIDTLFEIADKGDCEKAGIFADVIHNMPEICMGLRPLHTFFGEISAFRNMYGEKYFPFFKDEYEVTI